MSEECRFFTTWQEDVRAINPAGPREDRIAAYVRLFKIYWEPNGVPFLDALDK
jgi:hypothetical protein